MLKWVSKLVGGSRFDLPEGVPEAWVHSLQELLAPLDKVEGAKGRSGLVADIINYVLKEEPLAFLNELGQREEVGKQLHLVGYYQGGAKDALPRIYEHFGSLPASVALRWARVLESSVTSHTAYCRLTLPRDVHWPEVLLLSSAGTGLQGWSSQRRKARDLSSRQIEAMLTEDGLDPSALLVAGFASPVGSSYGSEQRLLLVTDLVDYPEALDRHVEAIRPHLLPVQVPQRLHVLKMLGNALPATLDNMAPQLSELGVVSSKQVRSAAEDVLRKCSNVIFAPLRSLALEGKPEQRGHALRLMAMLAQERGAGEIAEFARATAAADKAPSVQALLAEWESDTRATQQGGETYTYTLPVIDWSGSTNFPGEDRLRAFWSKVNESIRKSNAGLREHHARMLAQGKTFALRQEEEFTSSDASALSSYLASDQAKPPERALSRRNWSHVSAAIQTLASTKGVTPVALLRVTMFFGLTGSDDRSFAFSAAHAFTLMHRQSGRPTLLELSTMLDDIGLSGESLLRNYCYSWGTPFASDWPNEDVWPFFAHHIDALVQALTRNTIKDYSFTRAGLFRAVATLPSPPAAAINALFALALGPGKTDRGPAQEALQHHPDKESRIVDALSDGKAETRAIAAQWLGRLRHMPAIPALETAVAKEKQDLAKGAMLDALQMLGQPVEKYLDRDALSAEAAKSLGKGLPKDAEWFPWNSLPPVRWADSLAPVPQVVLQWMLVQALKQKSPEPNAVLRKYCAMFEPRDREALGQFVLETWLQEDIRAITPEEATQQARSAAQSMHTQMTRSPQYFQNSPHIGKSVEEIFAAYLPASLRQPAGSAVNSKGLLAVAAACAGERAAAPTQRYLKDWYGSRAAQGKALIAMLAWIEHPSATQLMLAIGSRFRTKSFQEEATRQAEALAERKGWTLAELADRTVPSAGFDETGTLELSYGPRQFSAKLLPDFKVELFNPDGKKIASLPEPRQDDDEGLAKVAKKTLGAAKKEVKSIVDLQTDRLYEALCMEREWPFADWVAYLQQHPVLRYLVQRLVWVQVDDGKVARIFRPLDDGTLTDCDDNEVTLADDARVRLAHDSLLSAGEVKAWQQHLADYEIKSLFQQLGKGTYVLPADKAQADEIKDYEGHVLEAFSLRGRALKLGYTRGAAEDGGWFHVYEKRFPTLGLQAIIEFTGNPLPEENRTVALLSLSFANSGEASSYQRGKLSLAKVPRVLLSECYNDLRLIAADGRGYDADWRKKCEY